MRFKGKLKCNYIYNNLMHSKVSHNKALLKWNSKLNLNIPDIIWNVVCARPFVCSSDIKLRWFQYRIIHRLIPTNNYLHMIKLKNSNLCDFCNSCVKTIEHLFFYCIHVKTLWVFMQNIFFNCQIFFGLHTNVELVLFGGDHDRMFNLIIHHVS